jgi:hypothetical protein
VYHKSVTLKVFVSLSIKADNSSSMISTAQPSQMSSLQPTPLLSGPTPSAKMSSHAKTKGNHTKQHHPSTRASAKQQQHHSTQTPSSSGTSAGQKRKRNEGNSTEQDATSSEQPGDDAADANTLTSTNKRQRTGGSFTPAKKPEPYTGQKVYAIKKNTFEDPDGSLSRLKVRFTVASVFFNHMANLTSHQCAVELVIRLLSGAYNGTEVLELPTAQRVANIEQA